MKDVHCCSTKGMSLYDLLLPFLGYASWFYFSLVHFAFAVWNSVRNRVSIPKPTDEDLNQLLLISATQAAEMIRTREVRSQQLIEVYIRRIQYVDNLLNAVVVENYDEAIETAKAIDDYIESLDPESDEYKNLETEKPLLGVPFTCKDTIRVKGLRTICGIPAFSHTPLNDEDADVIVRLRKAGAVFIAVTNVPEAGLWWETSNGIYGLTRNPYDLRLTPGGSSGGEGALISAAGSIFGVGSDFGGSIRIPAALNGIFGLKPSPGLVPFKGHVPEKLPKYHMQMVSLGPLCRYARDLSIMFKTMVGPENVRSLKLDEPVNLRNVRVFYMNGLNSLLCSPVSEDCSYALQKAVKYFEKKYDNAVYKVDFPIAHYAVDIFMNSMKCPGSLPVKSCLAGFTADHQVNVWVEALKSIFGQSEHSWAALQAGIVDELPTFFNSNQDFVVSKREQLKREINELLGDEGILLFPSFPRSYYYHNEALLTPFDFVYTGLWNALGLPVISCPMGLNRAGVPSSVQIIAGPKADRLLLSVACDLEEGFGGWQPREIP